MNQSKYTSKDQLEFSKEDLSKSMWLHLVPLLASFFNFIVAFPYLGLLAAVFMYFNHKEKEGIVRTNAVSLLNFQITLTIVWTLFMGIIFMFIGSFFLIFSVFSMVNPAIMIHFLHFLGYLLSYR
jgi:uncharacterized Tic20 family protein